MDTELPLIKSDGWQPWNNLISTEKTFLPQTWSKEFEDRAALHRDCSAKVRESLQDLLPREGARVCSGRKTKNQLLSSALPWDLFGCPCAGRSWVRQQPAFPALLRCGFKAV